MGWRAVREMGLLRNMTTEAGFVHGQIADETDLDVLCMVN